jgi:hypothetical protein
MIFSSRIPIPAGYPIDDAPQTFGLSNAHYSRNDRTGSETDRKSMLDRNVDAVCASVRITYSQRSY